MTSCDVVLSVWCSQKALSCPPSTHKYRENSPDCGFSFLTLCGQMWSARGGLWVRRGSSEHQGRWQRQPLWGQQRMKLPEASVGSLMDTYPSCKSGECWVNWVGGWWSLNPRETLALAVPAVLCRVWPHEPRCMDTPWQGAAGQMITAGGSCPGCSASPTSSRPAVWDGFKPS